jgi:hypothetical protein
MTVFWDVAPCSHVQIDRRFRGDCCLHHQGDELAAREKVCWETGRKRQRLGPLLYLNPLYASYLLIALMMEAVRTSETSVNFNQTTRCNNPDDSHLHTRRRENLKSQKETNLVLAVSHVVKQEWEVVLHFWVGPTHCFKKCSFRFYILQHPRFSCSYCWYKSCSGTQFIS